MNQLVLAAEHALDLDKDVALIAAFGQVAKNWASLAAKIDGITTLDAFVDQLAGDIGSDSVKTVFTDAGFGGEWSTLVGYANELKHLGEKIPPKYKLLLRRLAEFNDAAGDGGKVDWALRGDKLLTPVNAAYSVMLGGQLGVAFEAGDTWRFNDQAMPPRLLRLGVAGKAEASGAAKLPFQFGTFGLSGGGGVDLGLDYYFDAGPPEAIYALAVAKRLTQLPDPFSFNDVWDGFAASDLAGIVYRLKTSANVAGSVTVAATTELLENAATFKGGLEVGFSLAISGDYSMSVRGGDRAAGGRELIVTLSRARASVTDVTGSLGVTIDLSRLAERIHAVLASVSDAWDPILNEIKPFLSPGTWLRSNAGDVVTQAVKDLLGDDDLAQAVTRDLRGTLGIDPEDGLSVLNWAEKALTGAIDRATGALTSELGQARKSAFAALAGVLPAFAQAEFAPKLAEALNKLVDEARSKLDGEVAKLAQATPFRTLATAIGRTGATINDAVAEADKPLAGVRALIDHYEALFQKVMAVTEDAAKAKISARFQFEQNTSSGATYQFAGTLTARSAAAEGVFNAVLGGDFTSLVKLLENPGANPDVSIDRDHCSIEQFSKRVSTNGFEVVVIGFGIEGATVLTSRAGVVVDGTGRVTIDAEANLSKRFKGLDETRELTFADVYTLALAGSQRGPLQPTKQSLDIGFGILNQDPSMSRGELEAFLLSLESARLLTAGATKRAGEQFDRWSGPGRMTKLSADLSVKLWLPQDSIPTLLQRGERASGALSLSAVKTIITTAINAGVESGALNKTQLAKAAGLAIEDYRPFDQHLDLWEAVYYFPMRWREVTRVYSGSTDAQQDDMLVKEFQAEQEKLNGLVKLIGLLGDVWDAHPSTVLSPDPKGWDARHYRQAQDAVGEYIKPWFLVNRNFIFWVRSAVHPRTVALLRTICDLAGHRADPPVSVVMTNRSVPGQPETVVVT